MYILQISDFHISDCKKISSTKKKIEQLQSKLKEIIPAESEIVCCLLGDFTDKGNSELYTASTELLDELRRRLLDVVATGKVEFELVPGNHDLCDTEGCDTKTLDAFNHFASAFLNEAIDFSDEKPIRESTHFGYNFISIDSVLHGEIGFGSIDINLLGKCVVLPDTIMLSHHGVTNSDSNDSAAIRNGSKLLSYLEKNEFLAFLHGHTHGYNRVTIGRDCQVIGSGAIDKDESAHSIWNQCNLINVCGSAVKEVQILTFYGDREEWGSETVYTKHDGWSYFGNSAYTAYSKILKDVTDNGQLFNVRIQLQNTFKAFETEITSQFSEYERDALDWQNDKCPDTLTNNHGVQLNGKDISWLDFVVNSLSKNPTSKRTIIPLINKETAFHSRDDQYLVSFDVVQMGFASNDCQELIFTLYMRAMEVRHFLPINLYEIYLMIKRVRERIPTISKVSISVFAFSVQAKKEYACLRKTKIDLYTTGNLCSLLHLKKYSELIAMLEEKEHTGDTVIDTTWLKNLEDAIDNCYLEQNKNEVLEQLHSVVDSINILKQKRALNSDYTQTESEEMVCSREIRKLYRLIGENI